MRKNQLIFEASVGKWRVSGIGATTVKEALYFPLIRRLLFSRSSALVGLRSIAEPLSFV